MIDVARYHSFIKYQRICFMKHIVVLKSLLFSLLAISCVVVAGDYQELDINILKSTEGVSEQKKTRGSCGGNYLCNLSINCLSVCGRLLVNGIDFSTLVGTPGPAGPTGATGPVGPAGAQGIPGCQGIQGIPGIAGPVGPMGAAGATGPAGAQGIQGIQGLPGPQGVQGIPGVVGPVGPMGATGATGQAGAQGIQGTPGAAGSVGPMGATGAQGPAGLAGGILGYGYIYTLTQVDKVDIGAPILFDSNGPLLGIAHGLGTSPVVINNSGVYAITFSVSGTQPNQFALFVNGSPASSTVYSSNAGNQQNTGQVILTLEAGDAITIVNYSSEKAIDIAHVTGGKQQNVKASVLILQLA